MNIDKMKERTKQAYINSCPTLEIVPQMFNFQELLTLPPLGHRGVILFIDLPDTNKKMPVKVGDDVLFQIKRVKLERGQPAYMGDMLIPYVEEIRGRIIAIEKPNVDSIRPDIINTKARDRWKIHWVPIDVSDLQKVNSGVVVDKCISCGGKSKVTNTRVLESRIVRYRRCTRCRCNWITEETNSGPIKLQKRRKNEKNTVRS